MLHGVESRAGVAGDDGDDLPAVQAADNARWRGVVVKGRRLLSFVHELERERRLRVVIGMSVSGGFGAALGVLAGWRALVGYGLLTLVGLAFYVAHVRMRRVTGGNER